MLPGLFMPDFPLLPARQSAYFDRHIITALYDQDPDTPSSADGLPGSMSDSRNGSAPERDRPTLEVTC